MAEDISTIEYYQLHKDKYSIFDSGGRVVKWDRSLHNKTQSKSETKTKHWLDYDKFMTWELVAKADAERTAREKKDSFISI